MGWKGVRSIKPIDCEISKLRKLEIETQKLKLRNSENLKTKVMKQNNYIINCLDVQTSNHTDVQPSGRPAGQPLYKQRKLRKKEENQKF